MGGMSPAAPGRASPLAPDDRRQAIIRAVLPLVRDRGAEVTSKELAVAAGVAEGTLFRAFGDKSSLVHLVAMEGLRRSAGPTDTSEALAAIDLGLPLEDRIAEVMTVGGRRALEREHWIQVLAAVHRHRGGQGGPSQEQVERFRTQLAELRQKQRRATLDGLLAVLTPDRHRLRVPPEVAATLVEATVSGMHQALDPTPDASAIADALVNGIAPSVVRPC